MSDQAKKERVVEAIMPQRRALAEHVRQTHVITVENAEHPEDFLKPEFYALIAKDMQVGDHCEIRDDEMSFNAEYLVTACDRTWAKVALLRQTRIDPVQELEISPDYKVQFKGPHKKWCVLRLADKSIVSEAHQDRQSANTWLIDYVRTTGRKAA